MFDWMQERVALHANQIFREKNSKIGSFDLYIIYRVVCPNFFIYKIQILHVKNSFATYVNGLSVLTKLGHNTLLFSIYELYIQCRTEQYYEVKCTEGTPPQQPSVWELQKKLFYKKCSQDLSKLNCRSLFRIFAPEAQNWTLSKIVSIFLGKIEV